MSKQFDVRQFVKDYKTAASAVKNAFSRCRTVAADLATQHDPTAEFKAEHARLIQMGKDVLAEQKVPSDRNVWQHISAALLIEMAPSTPVELPAGKKQKDGKNEPVIKSAEDCQTAREVRTAAKQIREVQGMSDGRQNNTKKPSTMTGEKAEKKAEEMAADLVAYPDLLAAFKKAMQGYGFTITENKASTAAKGKKVAAPGPKGQKPTPARTRKAPAKETGATA